MNFLWKHRRQIIKHLWYLRQKTYPQTKVLGDISNKSNKWYTTGKKLQLSIAIDLRINIRVEMWIESNIGIPSIFHLTDFKLNVRNIRTYVWLTLTSSTLISDFLSDLIVNDGLDRNPRRDKICCESWMKGGYWLSYLDAIEIHVTARRKIWFLRFLRVPSHDTSELFWTSLITPETCFHMKFENNVDPILATWGPGILK